MAQNNSAMAELGQTSGGNSEGSDVLARAAALRAVEVTETVPMPIPLASGYELGSAEQVVAWAGTVHERVTVEENPKNGVTPISFMYDAVRPAATVCAVIPRFATVKSAAKFNTTGAEVEAP